MAKTIEEYIDRGIFTCKCGKVHGPKIKKAVIGDGVLEKVPEILKELGGTRAFVISDPNTLEAAGKRVCGILDKAGVGYTSFTFCEGHPEPDEKAVGSVMLHYDSSCDVIVGVGSGVVNDIGKIIADIAHAPYVIVGTAPSMDGYASGTSSVIRDNLKVSVNSHCPDVVVGDLDVLSKAPLKMLQSGIGDMIAKYISIAEWRISNIINGEYYCEDIAAIINDALKKCVDTADGVKSQSKDVCRAVMEGMVLSGVAANYAGISRPVSGMEHYFSHVWDMRMIEFGRPADLHGIQCGIGTIDAIKVYDEIKKIKPDKKKALAYVAAFDYEKWKEYLRTNLGRGAEQMIKNEEKEKKYDKAAHAARLERIIARWDEIIGVINGLPSLDEIEALFEKTGAPKTAADIELTKEEERMAFLMTKDIRDKYIASRLLWDLGELDDVCDKVFPIK
ncbi:MAG: sn-glycerol-1-phosphate dehydrogenase [Clostridia bacterium]|nr:sn-glycerol-1-phosphate dehydrogenase [Clostridia bacterium]MBO4428781.1 sn-glycerol-1-phosphate dehydrogenase [Clostridia bacterium]